MATATATTLQEGTTAAKPDLSQPRPNPTADNKAEQPPPSIAGTVLSSKGGDATKDPEAGKDIEAEKKGEPVTDVQKKIRRAERFGMPVQLSEEEKRNSRAERFGAATAVQSSSDALKKLEEQKRKARADRFGIVQSAPSDEEAKKKARLDRFGVVPKADVQEEEKKKARALRFSQATAGSLSQVNGKGTDVETKKAIEGKNTGGGT